MVQRPNVQTIVSKLSSESLSAWASPSRRSMSRPMLACAVARDHEHPFAELDPCQPGVGRVVGQVAGGADGDFEDVAASLAADPLAAALEQEPLEKGDLLVVAGRFAVL